MIRKCSTSGCKRKSCKGYFCTTCVKRKWRKNNPLEATYADLRSNAKRRGKPFGITLSEWRIFCDRYNYLELRGRGAEDLTVDCKNEYVGYYLFNMRAITNTENVEKENSRRARVKAEQDRAWEERLKVIMSSTPPESPLNPEITPF